MRPLEASDYEMGPSFTKEFSLVGKDKKKEKVRVMEKPSLFNKNFKVVGLLRYSYEQVAFLLENLEYVL